jgi:hypothetical protein
MESTNNYSLLKQIEKIETTVRELNKEKEKIQRECKHQEKSYIDFDEKKNIKKYCSMCKKALGYATEKEGDYFLMPKGKTNT